MKITKNSLFTIVKPEKSKIEIFESQLNDMMNNLKSDNIIVDLLDFKEFSITELIPFIKLSNEHRKLKRSFVFINKSIEIFEIPEEVVIVPTLQEAQDIIEMEEIERDLGF